MNRNLKIIAAIFLGAIIVLVGGNVIIIGDKIGQLTHVYVEYVYYGILFVIGCVYLIRPMIKIHLSPEFPVLKADEGWDSDQLYAFAKKLSNNCSYISNKQKRSEHRDYLDAHIDHHCAEADKLQLIISTEVNRRIAGDPKLEVLGIDNRIKEWGKTVFMITAVSQSNLLDTVSVLIINYRMISDIVLASGFRPTKPQLFNIYIKVLSTAFFSYCTSQIFTDIDDLQPFNFAGSDNVISPDDADLGDIDSSDVGFGNTIIQRIKTIKIPGLLVESAAQGCINALMTMRIGYVTKAYILNGSDVVKGTSNKRITKHQAVVSSFKAMPDVILSGAAVIGGTVAAALEKMFSKEKND